MIVPSVVLLQFLGMCGLPLFLPITYILSVSFSSTVKTDDVIIVNRVFIC
jgi:hypothetical protein